MWFATRVDGYTALMAACGSTVSDESLILDCVNKLIQAGADVDARDRFVYQHLWLIQSLDCAMHFYLFGNCIIWLVFCN